LISALDDEFSNLDVLEENYDQSTSNHFDNQTYPSQDYMNPRLPPPNHQVHFSDSNPPPSTKRVTTCASPYLNVFFHHTPLRFTLDTGATVNMILESTARHLGLKISPSSQIATQADGQSEINIVGEVHFQVIRDHTSLHFEGLVAKKMDTEVLAGIPFCTQNDISVHPAKRLVMIGESIYPYGGASTKASVARVQSSIARCNSTVKTVWPGDYLEATCDINPSEDTEIAIEPHWQFALPKVPIVTTCLKGKIRLLNDTKFPVHVKKNQHVGHIVQTACLDESPSLPTHLIEKVTKDPLKDSANIISIAINPDKCPDFSCWESKFASLHKDFEHVFSSNFPGYNGYFGKIEASVNVTDQLPPQRKGRIPLYQHDKLVDLQNQFDNLETKGVYGKPESIGINVEYVNPSFLVKRSDGGYRLVTAFGDVAKHCKPTPSLMPNVESTLRQIGQWKYIIKTDLTKAYFQIPLQRSSQKFCGVVTPFRGIRVYLRSAMGMPGSESALEELMSRILGDLLLEGKVAKIADDLYCGSDISLDDLFSTWENVLHLMSKGDHRLNAPKTVILPLCTTILGWIWNQGTLSASSHQISPLLKAKIPKTDTLLYRCLQSFKQGNKGL